MPETRATMHRRALLAAAGAMIPGTARAAAQVTTAWPVNAGPLNPHLYAPNQLYAQAMLYEPLVRYAEGGRIEPWLAESWSIEDGGRSYLFRLRQGVRFSDGTAFDAAAVKANVDAVLANRPRHAWLALIERIAGLDVFDPATVRLRLDQPYYPTLLELSLIRPLRFLSPAAFPADGNTAQGIKAAIGTGPWKLAETVRGVRDVFVRNDAYWGPKPAVGRLVVRVLPDPTTRALALQAGEIDLLYGSDLLGPETYRRLAGDGGFTAALSPPLASRLLLLNAGRGPTAELPVRQAILHGVNRASLVRNVLLDTERPAETLFAPNVAYADLGLALYAFDRGRAEALLGEAGWGLPRSNSPRRRNGIPLEIELAYIGSEALQKATAEAVQGDLARLAIRVRLVAEEAGSFYARQKSGEFGMIFGNSWGAPYDPHAFAASMRAPAHADYQAQSGLPMKPELDRRIGAALAASDEASRAAEWGWVLRILHEQAVYLPVSYLTNKLVARRGGPRMPFGHTQYEIPFERMEG